MHGGHQPTLDVPVILHARDSTHAEEVYTGPYLLLRERVGRQAIYGRCIDVPGRLFRIRIFCARSSLDYHRDFLPLYVPWREWSPQRGLEISWMVMYTLKHFEIIISDNSSRQWIASCPSPRYASRSGLAEVGQYALPRTRT